MIRQILAIIISAGILSVLFSCSDSDLKNIQPTSPDFELTPVEKRISQSMNTVGLDVFNVVSTEAISREDYNVSFSPISLTMSLSLMANAGDIGFERDFMQSIGCVNIDDLNSLNKKLMMFLPDKSNESITNLYNSVWYSDEYDVKASFADIVGKSYFSDVRSLDFESGNAHEIINSWCDKSTRGKIKDLLMQYELRGKNIAFANAADFKGSWYIKFGKDETRNEMFHGLKRDCEVAMMHANDIYRCFEARTWKSIQIGFKGNNQFIAILPDDFNQFMEQKMLNAETLDMINRNSMPYWVDLKFPRFKTQSTYSLNSALEKVGLSIGDLKFENLFAGKVPPVSTDIKQAVSISVDEEGCEAAAVTINLGYTDLNPSKKIALTFDRPFVYLIRNTVTGSIIMAGQYTQP